MRKYILYAIGEISLVVIGILIALQIDAWNENNKKQELINSYIKSLHRDLVTDTIQLTAYNRLMEEDLKLISGFSLRLSKKEATNDTLLAIIQKEFLPYFSPTNAFNNSTYSALIASGNIDLLDRWLNEDLNQLNAQQLEAVKVIDFNMNLYMNSIFLYQNKYSWNHPLQFLQGKFQNKIWQTAKLNELIPAFNGIISMKKTMQMFIVMNRNLLLERTRKLINRLNSEYPSIK